MGSGEYTTRPTPTFDFCTGALVHGSNGLLRPPVRFSAAIRSARTGQRETSNATLPEKYRTPPARTHW